MQWLVAHHFPSSQTGLLAGCCELDIFVAAVNNCHTGKLVSFLSCRLGVLMHFHTPTRNRMRTWFPTSEVTLAFFHLRMEKKRITILIAATVIVIVAKKIEFVE